MDNSFGGSFRLLKWELRQAFPRASCLVRVDGFSCPEKFEVQGAHLNVNLVARAETVEAVVLDTGNFGLQE